ncbi:hypothetical protein [Bradyrhizobium sp. 195]|uniref:hypothetical protein n=1 Tax=Bradyrhizobium sp. 195 TaxID=2782662 RepID=UPI00200082F8|nr:hypothetical protein [Bradyrhizobium sp. 195]
MPDDINALDVAEEIEGRLLKDRPELAGRHFSILVTNQDGDEAGRVFTGCPALMSDLA